MQIQESLCTSDPSESHLMASSSQNFYRSIKEAKDSPAGTTINLIAKAIEFGIPKKSRGSDFFLTLKLIDETEPDPGFSVNIFEENLEKLPLIRFPGDIVSLHRVELNIHGGDLFCTFKKRISSFALFDGKAGGDLAPYQTSSTRRYMTVSTDKKLVLQLRALRLSCRQEDLKPLLLCDIKPHRELDIICKVLHVLKISNNGWIVHVWDGTDAPPAPLQMDLGMEATIDPEISILPREVYAFPKMGSVIEISIDKVFEGIDLLKSCDHHWVKFYNIIFDVQFGVWKGVLKNSSKIRIIFSENPEVLHRKRIYRESLSSYGKCSSLPSFSNPSLTVTDFELMGYSTLRASLTHPEVVHVFRTVVRVIALYPWRAKDLCSPNGLYRVRLTLEDPTARIQAFLFEEDGEKFFGGYPPHNVLTKKIKRLLGMTKMDNDTDDDDDDDDAGGDGNSTVATAASSTRNPPWICCCLKCYYIDADNPLTSRRYRIYGTAMID